MQRKDQKLRLNNRYFVDAIVSTQSQFFLNIPTHQRLFYGSEQLISHTKTFTYLYQSWSHLFEMHNHNSFQPRVVHQEHPLLSLHSLPTRPWHISQQITYMYITLFEIGHGQKTGFCMVNNSDLKEVYCPVIPPALRGGKGLAHYIQSTAQEW